MNKFIFTTLFACFVGSNVFAQQPSFQKAPRLKSFVRGHFTSSALPQKLHSKAAPVAEKSDAKVESWLTPSRAPRLLVNESITGTPADTALCTQHKHFENGKLVDVEKFQYDDRGLYSYVFKGKDEKNPTLETRYKYEYGYFNYWTSRLVEQRKSSDENWKVVNKEVRHINDQRQLVAVEKYECDWAQPDLVYLKRVTEYDYSHDVKNNSNETYRGVLVHEVSYDRTGKVEYEEAYEWCAPMNTYVKTYYLVDTSQRYARNETIFSDFSMITDTYAKVNGEEYISERYEKYWGDTDGECTYKYDANGRVSNKYGWKNEMRHNVPSRGMSTKIFSRLSRDGWEYGGKTTYKGCDEKGNPLKGKDYEINEYSYFGGEWNLLRSQKGTWMNEKILKVANYHVQSGERYDTYTLYKEDGTEFEEEFDYDPIDNLYVLYEYEGNNEIAKFYNLQDELVNQIRMEYPSTNNAYFDKEGYIDVFKMSVWKNGTWEPVRDKIEFVISDELNVFVFNKNGYVSEASYYDVTPENKVGTLSVKGTYTYMKNGYKIANIEYEEGVEYGKFDVETILTDKGYLQSTELDYDEAGNTCNGYRYVLTPDSVMASYYYDSAADKWDATSIYCPNITTKDEEKGLITEIERTVTPDFKIVNSTKRVTSISPEKYNSYEAEYKWDTQRNDWCGVSKKVVVPRTFNLPFKPLKMVRPYDDESLYPQIPNSNDGYIDWERNSDKVNYYSYVWNKEEWRWELNLNYESNFIDVQLYDLGYLVREFTEKDYIGRKSNYYTVFVDDNKCITSVVKDEINPYDGTMSRAVYSYSCNAAGYVTERQTTFYKFTGVKYEETGEKHVDQYEYENTKIFPTAIEEMKNEKVFDISGRAIHSVADAAIYVYDLSGRMVLSGKGNLTLPSAGTYVVKCGGISAKVTCR